MIGQHAVTLGAQTNYLRNPDMAPGVVGWAPSGAGTTLTLGQVDGTCGGATYSMRVHTQTAGAGAYDYGPTVQGYPAAELQEWTASLDVNAPAGVSYRVLLVRYYRDASGTVRQATLVAGVFTPMDGTCKRLTVTATTPVDTPNATTTGVGIYGNVDSATPTDAYFSNGQLRCLTTEAYADVSCLVDSLSIRHGRDGADGQPEASTATFDMSATPLDPLPAFIDVGTSIRVTTTLAGQAFTRFVGTITDLELGWDDAGPLTPDAGLVRLTAASTMADLGRRVVGAAPFPQELDGARVSRVLGLAGVPGNPLLNDPGTVQILPRDIDSQPALDVAREAATSAGGLVWQARTGETLYADADHRRNVAVSLDLDSCNLLVSPKWKRDIAGLVNDVSIGYGVPPEGGEQPRYLETEPDSIARYGRFAYTTATVLAAQADAQEMARLLLVRNASPVWIFDAAPLDMVDLDQASSMAVLNLDVHSLVRITGLPSLGAAPTSVAVWVEGWTERLEAGVHDLDLYLSGYCRTVPPPIWNGLDPTWVWGGVTWSETRRNLAVQPVANGVDGWLPNNQTNNGRALKVPISDHPLGIATAAEVTALVAGTLPASLYNVSGLASSPIQRGTGVWVRPPYDCTVAVYMTSDQAGTTKTTPAPGGVWTYATTKWTGSGYDVVNVSRVAPGGAAVGDKTLMTGSICEADRVPSSYFDGNTYDTPEARYDWLGTPGTSASTLTESEVIPDGLPPDLTWDDATCLGPPVDRGRWSDVSATLRWVQIPPDRTWQDASLTRAPGTLTLGTYSDPATATWEGIR